MRGRIAPTPSGELHLGHAATFLRTQQSIREKGGELILRIEDIDKARCKDVYVEHAIDLLKEIGIDWDEGPDLGGPYGPYLQSQRIDYFKQCLFKLKDLGLVYPCGVSRKQLRASQARTYNHELILPDELKELAVDVEDMWAVNWRFRVPKSLSIDFYGHGFEKDFSYTEGEHFSDFLVWRRDGMPSYELAVVADDQAMKITEVVRGADLLLSTARQILLYRAFDWDVPKFYHCPLILGEDGERLSKTKGSASLLEFIKAGGDWQEQLRQAQFSQ